MNKAGLNLMTDISKRATCKDVQKLGEQIGVELSDQFLENQRQKYKDPWFWHGALHELGHLVLNKAHVNWEDPRGPSWDYCKEVSYINRDADLDDEWIAFEECYKPPFVNNHLKIDSSGIASVPDEWTVQSWCFEVAKAQGWLEQEESEILLAEEQGFGIRMFWSSGSIDCFSRYILAGRSDVNHKGWTLKRQHKLQLKRLRLFGVDIEKGLLVPTKTGAADGPFINIVDVFGKVHHRIPRTFCPEVAPYLWAIWNWYLAFGELPEFLRKKQYGWFLEDNWLNDMKVITDALQVQVTSYVADEIKRLTVDQSRIMKNRLG